MTDHNPEINEVYEEAKRRAAAMADLFNELPVVTEAELAAADKHPVSIVHGDAETEEDARLIFQVLPGLAQDCGPPSLRRGGNDYTTFVFDAAAAAVVFIAEVSAVAPRWWRITPTAQPVWG